MTIYAVIMAGGSGTRFWPLSRQRRPKQFLSIGTARPLIVETVERLSPTIPVERVHIVAGHGHVSAIEEHLPQLGLDALIIEPCARNTAPCIGLAAIHIAARDPDAVMAVLPADHHISQNVRYRELIQAASERAEQGDIVTLGIEPTRPETGYGYIEFDDQAVPEETSLGIAALSVARFVEKPDLETAHHYLSTGRFLWNSGMFFFTPRTILAAFARHLPDIFAGLERIRDTIGTSEYSATLQAEFSEMRSVSIDYGIMEPVSRPEDPTALLVIPADIGWNDVGHWAALEDYADQDEDGNIVNGSTVLIDAQQNIIHADSATVAVVGLDNVIVVQTGDAVLVCPKTRAQDVRAIVDDLKAKNRKELL